MNAVASSKPDYHKWILILILGLTAFRVLWLFLTPLNLHGDEAQYWAWSRDFDFGYFSKPPMIAWVIAATTGVFGNEEWAIRLSSPLIHGVTAYLLFRTGRFLFDARTGFFAACLYFLMPAVWLSSGIVSTDVTLLLFWTISINAWAHLREAPSLRWAVQLGVGIGLGMLSKYAMLFFIAGLVLVTILDKKTRAAMFAKYGVVAGLLAGLITLPNILWNAANDFATVGHTAANANIQESIFHPVELLEFFGSQFGVFGPITFALLLIALWVGARKKLNDKALLLAVFALTPLLVICAQALLSRANANWAVSCYIGGSLLTAYFITQRYPKTGKAGIWLNALICGSCVLIALSPTLTDQAGFANSVKRMRGWPETASQVTMIAKAGHDSQTYSAIATDQRLTFFQLNYYDVQRGSGVPLKSWLYSKHINNHAEANWPLPASDIDDPPVLIVNYFKDYEKYLRQDFQRLEPLAPIELELGGGKTRVFYLWAGYGYSPTQDVR